jgi:hypothetical protein
VSADPPKSTTYYLEEALPWIYTLLHASGDFARPAHTSKTSAHAECLPSSATCEMERISSTLSEFLVSHPSTKYFRLHYADLSGILHTRILTAQYFLSLVSEGQHLRIGGKAMLHSLTDKTSSIVSTVGLVELQPDWRSLRPCGYAPVHASVMCFV